MCVWATGVGPTPLTMKLAEKIPEQNHNKALVADEYLRIKGIPNQNISFYRSYSSTFYLLVFFLIDTTYMQWATA